MDVLGGGGVVVGVFEEVCGGGVVVVHDGCPVA